MVVKPEDGAELTTYHHQGLAKAMSIDTLDRGARDLTAWRANGVRSAWCQNSFPAMTPAVGRQWLRRFTRRDHRNRLGQICGLHQPEVMGNAAMILVNVMTN